MGIPSTNSVAPKSQSAVVANEDAQWIVWDEAPCPQPGPKDVFVKTGAIAINPSDTKMIGDFQTPRAILGTDYAGTVIAVGSEVKRKVEVGDRICGASHGMNEFIPEKGAFGRYNVSNGDVWLKLPSSWSVEAGASLGAGLSTAILALKYLGLPTPYEPAEKPFVVLVYGGSTATGTLALQLLRLSNLIPITTCSPRNFDLVKSYGAEEVFDYRKPTVADDIRAYTKNNLAYALDCITIVESTKICYASLGRAGGRYCALDPYPEHAATRKVVKPNWALGPMIFGEDVGWPGPYNNKGQPELAEFASKYFLHLQQLLDQGKIRHHPLRILEGGLEEVLEGMKIVESGVLSGEKVVVKFED